MSPLLEKGTWAIGVCECQARMWLITLVGTKCETCGATVREAKVREVR